MLDYSDHNDVMQELKKSQDADQDNREKVREAHEFLDKRDGQWESNVLNGDSTKSKPRYTIDMTTNVVNQVSGKLSKADFAGDIKPIGGEASKDVAMTLDGIVRNIQVISNADHTYNKSTKGMVTSGLDGWEVVQDWIDADAFDQDLLIKNVENFVDRVWFDVAAEEQDRSDSRHAWKFTAFTPQEYKSKWPDGSEQSLDANRTTSEYFNKPDLIMVGEFFYIKKEPRELVLMSNNAVYTDDDDFKKVKKELGVLGITEVRRRKRDDTVVYSRKMDADGWLEPKIKTVFDFIPLIPIFGNYKISDNKTIYYGLVEKRLDPQRIYNYAVSRQVEEGALAPRSKIVATQEQVAGHTDEWATLNTNADPALFYNHKDGQAAPYQMGGAQVNQGLQITIDTMGNMISQTAGLFEANLGANPRAQSGVAIDSLKDQGDIGTIDYFQSREIAVCHTMRVLLKAIPKVYVGDRQTRVLKEDGSFNMVSLAEMVLDEESGKEVLLNNLALGTYDVTCTSGPSFQNKQQETVAAMVEMGGVDPSIIAMGGDILLGNVTAPGMGLLANRKRVQLFQQGIIPEDEWTEEEQEQVAKAQQQALQQPPEPDPLTIAAQAEQTKAEAQMLKATNEQSKIILQHQKQQGEQQKMEFDAMMQQQSQQMDQLKFIVDAINKNAGTLSILKEVSGADGIISEGIAKAIDEQTEIVIEGQESL